jgi:hypothetical protein
VPTGRMPSPHSDAPHSFHDHGPVVLQVDDEGVWARPATWRERIASHLLGDRLDQALASGIPPEADPLLALRAAQIARPRCRNEMVSMVRRLLEAADEPDDALFPPRSMAILPRVRQARGEFESLLEHLEAPVPLPARGLASVKLLLRDGAGPLYRCESRQNLGRMVRAITDMLDPSVDWSLG